MIKTRIISYVLLSITISGCAAIPPALTYIGYIKTGADCISYLATKKSTSDHLVSAMLKEDCAMHRVLWNEKICHEKDNRENIATLRVNALATKPAAGSPN